MNRKIISENANIIEDYDSVRLEKEKHKLVLKDVSDFEPNTGRSNAVLKVKCANDANNENFGESVEEIIEDGEDSYEDIKSEDMFFNLIKLNYVDYDYEEMRYFVQRPIPEGNTFMCNVIKKAEGLDKLFPKYIMNVYNNNKFILAAKKIFNSTASRFEFSLDKEFDEKYIVGRMSSNFVGTIFNLYDEGKEANEVEYIEDIRQQYASITYIRKEVNLFGMKGPTKLKVYLPDIDKSNDNDYFCFKPFCKEETIHSKYKEGQTENILLYKNKSPKWSEKYNAYILNFNGRVQKKSTKNFQLESEKGDSIILQFGKINDTTFSLDFQMPLCPLQAFAICVSCLDSKFACE